MRSANAADALSGVKAALTSVLDRLTAHSPAAARLREIDRLKALSDAELARLGLTRDRIVWHAFRDALI